MQNNFRRGFTLIELMVSMTIGLMILLAVSSVYLSSQQTSRTNNALAYMQDNGRIALELLASHLSHAGFFGRIIFVNSINGKATDPTPLTYTKAGTECTTDWAIDITTPIQVFNNSNPYQGTCIDDLVSGPTQWSWIENTDIIEIRNVETTDMLTTPAGYPNAGQVYVIGDVNGGSLFFGNTQPGAANYSPSTRGVHAVNAYAYFVAQRSFDSGATWQPTLMRVETFPVSSATTTAFSVRRVEIIPGIEDMQIEIGRDTTGDNQADTWSNADTGTDYSTVKALRIWLLIRAEDIDMSFNPNGTAITYNLGQQDVTRNDRFRRMVLTRTIRLLNNRG